MSVTNHSPRFHKPRRLIGPDQIHALRDLAKCHTGNLRAFDACVVQTTSDNRVSPDIDVSAMRLPQGSGDFTYDQLIDFSIGEAKRLRDRLDKMPRDQRLLHLDKLLRDAQKDGRVSWVLSAACLRKLIFPNSYDGTRTDNVHYPYRPKDGACGKGIVLSGLTPNNIKRFLGYAKRMASTVPAETITPISLPE